jgi:hypothetical protein
VIIQGGREREGEREREREKEGKRERESGCSATLNTQRCGQEHEQAGGDEPGSCRAATLHARSARPAQGVLSLRCHARFVALKRSSCLSLALLGRRQGLHGYSPSTRCIPESYPLPWNLTGILP